MLVSKTIMVGKRRYTIWGNGNDPWEAFMDLENASIHSIKNCGLCESDNLVFRAYKAQGKYKYLQVRCLACKASLTCGNRQDNPNLYYYRRDKNDHSLQWEEYKESDSKGSPEKSSDESSDLPF